MDLEEPNGDSVYMFCYTSGTTGNPKAVKLTHLSVLSAAEACMIENLLTWEIPPDVYMSYLPLSHSFE